MLKETEHKTIPDSKLPRNGNGVFLGMDKKSCHNRYYCRIAAEANMHSKKLL